MTQKSKNPIAELENKLIGCFFDIQAVSAMGAKYMDNVGKTSGYQITQIFQAVGLMQSELDRVKSYAESLDKLIHG